VLLNGESMQGFLLAVGGDLDILKGSKAIFNWAYVKTQLRLEAADPTKSCHGLSLRVLDSPYSTQYPQALLVPFGWLQPRQISSSI
jgi:hypothetical protein